MVYVFEKMRTDENKDIYSVRETTGKILMLTEDVNKLVEFYSNLGV